MHWLGLVGLGISFHWQLRQILTGPPHTVHYHNFFEFIVCCLLSAAFGKALENVEGSSRGR